MAIFLIFAALSNSAIIKKKIHLHFKVHLKLITKHITVQFQFFSFEQLDYRFLSHQRKFSFNVNSRKACELYASSVTLFTELFTCRLGLWVIGIKRVEM